MKAPLCPACQSKMQSEFVNGFQIDICPSCLGIWFDEGELGKMANLPKQSFEPSNVLPTVQSEPLTRICPNCASNLESTQYQYKSSITIDCCPTCGGIFVDQGELDEIRSYLERSRNMTPAQTMSVTTGKITAMKVEAEAKQRAMKIVQSSMSRPVDPGDLVPLNYHFRHFFWDPIDFS